MASLLSTIGLSWLPQPSEWMQNAIVLTKQAWQKICDDNPAVGAGKTVSIFGRSLGGLLAFKWIGEIIYNQFGEQRSVLFCPPA